jgi:uncharacterized protein YbjT (DUF2867 family)
METENTQRTKTTLVLGGTGRTGRRVVERLAARGLPTRVGSRSGDPPFDCVKAGVQRLVLLSGRGEEEAQRAERVVQEADAEWTVVRCAWFSQNFSENYLLEPILGGEVALPAGDIPDPFVDADVIADVAVAALTEYGHAGQVYELTDPRLLTIEEAVGEIAKAAGREIRFVPISQEEYASVLAEHDLPADLMSLVTYLFGEVLDDRNAYLTDGVQRALGRKPRDFADYARGAAATGIWEGGR